MAAIQREEAGNIRTAESHGSLAPLLQGAGPASSKSSTKSSDDPERPESFSAIGESSEGIPTSGKRNFWKLGKKATEDKQQSQVQPPAMSRTSAPHIAAASAFRPASPLRSPEAGRASASPHRHPYGSTSSPSHGKYSSSPRLHSPASSQIFERNVQEDVAPPQASPQIPSHIITENHIPAALDASSAAITSEELDPDSVEIVTHALHQPASVTVTGATAEPPMSSSMHEDFGHAHRHELGEETASTYGALDTADVRRLSFISFADVVHAEHAEQEDLGRRESAQAAGLSTPPALAPRSPSPIRSTVSSHGLGTSPPTSISASAKGLETSPHRLSRGPASPHFPHSPPLGGELNIETMRQALRKTESGDLSGFRSQPMSAVGNEDGTFTDRPFR